jgi:hypothetical protein
VSLPKAFLNRLRWLSDDEKLALRWLVGDYVLDRKGANNYRDFLSGEDERKARKVIADKLRGTGDWVLTELGNAIEGKHRDYRGEEVQAKDWQEDRTLRFTKPKKTPSRMRKAEVVRFIEKRHRDTGETINKCFGEAVKHFGPITRRTIIKYWNERKSVQGITFGDEGYDEGEPWESME